MLTLFLQSQKKRALFILGKPLYEQYDVELAIQTNHECYSHDDDDDDDEISSQDCQPN